MTIRNRICTLVRSQFIRYTRAGELDQKMLEEFCQELDATLINGYLETDKLENVVLYERFDFIVSKVNQVLGVTTWYMIRP